ncbi:hypothetical protein J2X67_005517 [Variovorax sp. 3319]|nr:hypothetical protein [Variovorax sp. 3319]MDR6890969.1 hypothetical protein [Variovorax sp. 3319]
MGVLALLVTVSWLRRFETAGATGKRIIYFVIFAVSWTAGKSLVQPRIDRLVLASSIEGELLKNVTYVALKEHEPDTYKRVLDKLEVDIKAGAIAEAAYASMGREFGIVLEKRLPITSDAAAIAFMKVKTEQIKVLFDRGGDTCYLGLHPELVQDQAKLYSRFSPALEDAGYVAMAQVIRDARLQPMAAVTDAQIDETGVIDSLQLEPDVWADVANMDAPKADLALRRRDCEIWLRLQEAVLKLTEDRAGAFVRYQFAHA